MNWYEKLCTYFPVEEMKSKEQLSALLSEKGDLYIKDESDDYIVMYAEFDTFLFIDFILVSQTSRGNGIGHQVMEKLKSKNKPILLEVEPINKDDQDTGSRLRFYTREGFQQARSINYKFQAFKTKSETKLDILYWSEQNLADIEIMEAMKRVYEEIHSYQAEKCYGYAPKPVEEVLFISY